MEKYLLFSTSFALQLLSTQTCVEQWVCVNIVKLLGEDNTVPFMVRYRKDMINHMDADNVREVQLVYEEIWWVYLCLHACVSRRPRAQTADVLF